MEDRHSAEIASALKTVASAIGSLGISIVFGLVYVGCMISMASHH